MRDIMCRSSAVVGNEGNPREPLAGPEDYEWNRMELRGDIEREPGGTDPKGDLPTSSGWFDRAASSPIHTFLFSAYPVLALLSANLTEVSPSLAVRALAIALALGGGLLALGRLVLRTWARASLIASLSVLAMFSYGHIYSVLEPVKLLGIQLGRHRHLLPALALLLIFAWVLVRRREQVSVRLLQALNIISVTAIALPLLALGSYLLRAPRQSAANEVAGSAEVIKLAALPREQLPDVYYIIMDTYGREDVLRDFYQYDNSEFTQFLRSRGFYVAEESRSNYLWTHLSLSSALNLDYIPEIYPEYSKDSRARMSDLIKHSLVRRSLEAIGYSTVGFATGWDATELFDAAYVMTPDMTAFATLQQRGLVNEFEAMLLENSIGLVFLDLDVLANTPVGEFVAQRLDDRFTFQREIVLALYENLTKVPEIPGPKFVFAHSLPPHGPHLFGPEGETVDYSQAFTLEVDGDNPEGISGQRYLGELTYVTGRLHQIIDEILENSDRPVVIILQSDHGPAPGMDWHDPTPEAFQARSGILNAYYLPPNCRAQLYPEITPVNTFRLLFNCIFGAELRALEDDTYNGFYQFSPIDPILEGQGQ